MTRQDMPIELLFRVLPATPELKALRDAILSESINERERRWDGSAAYSTIDQRVVAPDTLKSTIAAAENNAVAHVRAVYASLTSVLSRLVDEDTAGVIARIAEVGEKAREEGAWQQCVDWYSLILSLGETWADREQLILAARRVGIAHLHLGNVRKSREAYEQSMRLSELADHREGRLVAHIGLGHLLAMQGRWLDAEHEYQRALSLCTEIDGQLAGQVLLNLAMTTREREDLTASARWLEQAHEQWAYLARAERSVWHNSNGLLLTESGDFGAARGAFESALAHSGSYLDTAMILDNLAHLCIRENDLTRAESYARRAEEFAIVGEAPRALVEVYTTLAMITRLNGEENGVGFLEKAIEISREEGYDLALAQALQEYALLRERMADHDAARALRLEAATVLDQLASQG